MTKQDHKITAQCSRCPKTYLLTPTSYKANCKKHKGAYICHGCMVRGEKVTLICKFCEKSFTIPKSRVKNHKNRRQYCSPVCSETDQSQQAVAQRKLGKKCSRCGEKKPIKQFVMAAKGKKNIRYNKIYQYCLTCKRKYRLIFANRMKMKAIKYLGGKCVGCGLLAKINIHPALFDFHHRDPVQKLFNLARCGKSWDDMKKELNKCDLLCTFCHRLKHINPELWEDYDTVIIES